MSEMWDLVEPNQVNQAEQEVQNDAEILEPPVQLINPSEYWMRVKSGTRLHEATCRMIVERGERQTIHKVTPCPICAWPADGESSFLSMSTCPANVRAFLAIGSSLNFASSAIEPEAMS